MMNQKQAKKLYELQSEDYQLLYTSSYHDGRIDEYSDCTLPEWESRPTQCYLKKEEWEDYETDFVFCFGDGPFPEEIDYKDIPVSDISARKIIEDYIYGGNIQENGNMRNE